MNNIEKKSNNDQLIHSEKKITKIKEINKDALSKENVNKSVLNDVKNIVDTKKIVLNTFVNVSVELGKSKIKIKDFLKFSKGSMLILDKSAKEPLDIFINGHLIASGEIVVSEKEYGVRITNIPNSLKNMNFVS